MTNLSRLCYPSQGNTFIKLSNRSVWVNTSSCWGVHPGPAHPVYIMTKAAVASLTQCLARDHAHQNIRVNAVCPLEVDTPMLRTGFATRDLNNRAPVIACEDRDCSAANSERGLHIYQD